MKKKMCAVCSRAKGKRLCRIRDGSLVCPTCCAKTRTPDCDGCIHYTRAEEYTKGKSLSQKSRASIVAIDPEIDDRVDQALAMAEKGRIRSGERILSKLLDEHPHSDMVQYGMGVVCLMKEDYDEAVGYFDRATEINPYFAEAWFNKGAAHHKRLELGETIRAYQRAVELGDPSDEFVGKAKDFLKDVEKKIREGSGLSLDDYLRSMDMFNEAHAAMEKREWEKALSGYKNVLAMDPRHTQSHGNLGICYARLGQKREALTALDKALELDPDYEPAIINRKIIASLRDGEILPAFESVEYYKDRYIRDTHPARGG